MQQAIKIAPRDNVAVALSDLDEGSILTLDGVMVTLRQPIGRGHKFALRPIAVNEHIIKYGLPIGHATQTIDVGEHVHAQNARTNLSDLDEYQYQPDFLTLPPQAADRDVQIYRRANGEVGIRNELWILPTQAASMASRVRSCNAFCVKPMTPRISTACISSVIRSAVRSWGRIMRIPAPCCKIWCVTLTLARCW